MRLSHALAFLLDTLLPVLCPLSAPVLLNGRGLSFRSLRRRIAYFMASVA
ncbi:hypothetical protein CBM2604_A20048 [Cupriavidus taiwanensis]|nr:hypothetical protein CBM2604_A20048 [Cupriavidus taiwanensis]